MYESTLNEFQWFSKVFHGLFNGVSMNCLVFFLDLLHADNIFTLQMTDYKENFKKDIDLLPKLPSKGRPFFGILTAFYLFFLVFSVWVPPGITLTLQMTDYKENFKKISTFYLNFLPKAGLFPAFRRLDY